MDNKNNKVKIRVKNVYGTDFLYPANKQAVKFLKLTGSKTFTQRHLEAIQDLGFEVEAIRPQVVGLPAGAFAR